MCKDCAERRKMVRDAFLAAKMGEAIKQIAIGAAEASGLKKKSAAKRVTKKAVKSTRQ